MKYASQTFFTVPNRNTLQSLNASAQLVFMWLCAMQDSAGRSFPSAKRLAELTHLGRSTVFTALKNLERAGLIVRATRTNSKGRTSNLYEVMILDTEPVLEPEEQHLSESTTRTYRKKVSPPHGLTENRLVHHMDGVSPPHGLTHIRLTKTTLTKSSNTTDVALLGDAKKLHHEMVKKLFYDAIKALDVPVTNHNVIRVKITEMAADSERDKIIKYLTFIRDQYAGLDWRFKPQINNALEIYTKRAAIRNSFKQHLSNTSSNLTVIA
jgi:DNA-binding transcriptional regulator YhcF (GntR family)